METKSKRGGARPNAGRQSKGSGHTFGCRLKDETWEILEDLKRRGIERTAFIEQAIVERYNSLYNKETIE